MPPPGVAVTLRHEAVAQPLAAVELPRVGPVMRRPAAAATRLLELATRHRGEVELPPAGQAMRPRAGVVMPPRAAAT